MRQFNYVVTPVERIFGAALPAAVPQSLRVPLAALACALIAAGLGYGVQEARVHAADDEAAVLTLRLSEAEVAVARVRRLANDVERMSALARRVEAIRNSGDLRANELAALGNDVPPDAWLTSIRVEARGLGIEGRGKRLDVVGTTMAALGRLPTYRGARLVHVHGEPPRAGVTYALALDPAR